MILNPAVIGCDVCRRKLTEADLEACKASMRAYAEAHPNQNLQYVTEALCSVCLPHAHAYWDERPRVIADAFKAAQGRLDNHRADFFRKRVLSEVRGTAQPNRTPAKGDRSAKPPAPRPALAARPSPA